MIDASTAPREPDTRALLTRGAAGVLIATAILAIHLSPLHEWLSLQGFQSVRASIDALGPLAPAAFVLLCIGGIGLGLPRLGFAAVGGLSFGWLAGCALAQVGTIGGCFVCFSWARYLGREIALRRRGRLWQGLVARVARRPVATNVLLRLIPVGNSLALNSFLGICPISSRDFLLGTAIGTFPETLVFALFGAGAASGSRLPLAFGSGLLLILLASTFAVSRRIRSDDTEPR